MKNNNTSNYEGVCFDSTWNKYKAYIQVAKKRYWLGNYHNLEDAIKARDFAKKQATFGILENGRYGNINFVLTAIKKIPEGTEAYDKAYEQAYTALIKTVLDFEKYTTEYLNTAICKAVNKYNGETDKELNEKFYNSIKGTDFEKWIAGDSLRTIYKQTGHHVLTISKEFYEKIEELRKELL